MKPRTHTFAKPRNLATIYLSGCLCKLCSCEAAPKYTFYGWKCGLHMLWRHAEVYGSYRGPLRTLPQRHMGLKTYFNKTTGLTASQLCSNQICDKLCFHRPSTRWVFHLGHQPLVLPIRQRAWGSSFAWLNYTRNKKMVHRRPWTVLFFLCSHLENTTCLSFAFAFKFSNDFWDSNPLGKLYPLRFAVLCPALLAQGYEKKHTNPWSSKIDWGDGL